MSDDILPCYDGQSSLSLHCDADVIRSCLHLRESHLWRLPFDHVITLYQKENDLMKVIYQGGQAEIERKKSRFIAHVAPASSVGEAQAFIADVKRQYWNARHNCSAYIIGDPNPLMHCSDDGEPAQTAGRPMLDFLISREVTDVCLVVTRYFGGTLLGTGGLVRAYTDASKAGLEASRLMEKKEGIPLRLSLGYSDYGRIEHLIAEKSLPLLSQVFVQAVELELLTDQADLRDLEDQIRDMTGGQARMREGDPISYGIVDGELVLDAQK